MSIEPKVVLWVFDKLRTTPSYLSTEGKLRPAALTELMNPEVHHFLVDDVGIIVVYPEPLRASAHVHITFWDKRLRGREKMCRDFADLVMDRWHYQYLWTAIPRSSRAILAFAKRVGFREFMEYETVKGLMLLPEGVT